MENGQPFLWSLLIRQLAVSACGLSMLAIHLYYRRRASKREELEEALFRPKPTRGAKVRAWLRYPAVLSWMAAGAIFLLAPKYLPAWRLPLDPRYAGWIGSLLCGTGTALFLLSHRQLGELWSIRAAVKAGHRVISGGPYRFIKHPLYAAVYLNMIGATLLISSYVMLVPLALSAAFYQQARIEEDLLKAALGGEYAEYARGRGMFIPRIRFRIRP